MAVVNAPGSEIVLTPFLELARAYRAVFFDSYGVLRAGDAVLPGVRGALAGLAELGMPAWVLTNDASRGQAGLAEVFTHTEAHVVAFANPITGGESACSVYVGRSPR